MADPVGDVAPRLRPARLRLARPATTGRSPTTSPPSRRASTARTRTRSPIVGLDEDHVRATFAAVRRALRHHRGVSKIGAATPAHFYARGMERQIPAPREDELREVLASAFAGRLVVLAGGPVAGATGRVREPPRDSARGVVWCSAPGRGTGALPSPADADVVQWALPPAADVPASMRAEERLFADLPAPFFDALARFDPHGEALLLAPPFSAVYEVSGRPAYGGRRPEWVALEDKTAVDELLAAAAIPTPPFEIVAADPGALAAAAARLDAGAGTVWAGDGARRLQRRRRLRALGPARRRGRCGRGSRAPHAALRAASASPDSSRASRAASTVSSPKTVSPRSGPSS